MDLTARISACRTLEEAEWDRTPLQTGADPTASAEGELLFLPCGVDTRLREQFGGSGNHTRVSTVPPKRF